ncbi:hypothetical protein CDN99_21840 [Roseateles aquatilis]|uniref:Uncharacterized protein n=1 Tax=Roseateles aquatilis TaxID=431061 RepID=A0A246IZE7_9BURK|nr:hypothetical protein [Roseateles aquatilis]OWQ85721.1 hypothetical protein CDN99_21840 [Roseateles aquatilis]
MGDADVRLQDGQPCFTITPKEAARGPAIRLQSVSINDASTTPVGNVWWVMLDQKRLATMSPASCVPYGQTPEGATAKPAVAPDLQLGRVYEVHLNTRPSDSSDPTRGYLGKFCLMADGADGTNGRKLVQVKADSREWTEGVCR